MLKSIWVYIVNHLSIILSVSFWGVICTVFFNCINYKFSRKKWDAERKPKVFKTKKMLLCFVHLCSFKLKSYDTDQTYNKIRKPFINCYQYNKGYLDRETISICEEAIKQANIQYKKLKYIYSDNISVTGNPCGKLIEIQNKIAKDINVYIDSDAIDLSNAHFIDELRKEMNYDI
jgi:hypothetical protein